MNLNHPNHLQNIGIFYLLGYFKAYNHVVISLRGPYNHTKKIPTFLILNCIRRQFYCFKWHQNHSEYVPRQHSAPDSKVWLKLSSYKLSYRVYVSLLIRSLCTAPVQETAIMREDAQELPGFIPLRHYFVSCFTKSVFGWTSAEICLPIYGVQWLVNAIDMNFKYERATFYILVQSHTVRLLATKLNALGQTQESISSLQSHMLLCKVQNSGDTANGAVVHGLLSTFSFSVPSPSHIQTHF